MKLPPPEAPAAEKATYADSLEDECVRDPNRAAWEMNKQRWLDLYTGNHFSDPLVSSAVAAMRLEPEQLNAAKAGVNAAVKLVYNRVMNAVLAMLAGQISNPPRVVFGARENGEPPIYYLNGYIQHPFVQQMAMLAGRDDPQVIASQAIYGGALPGDMEEVPGDPSFSSPDGGAASGAGYGMAEQSLDAGNPASANGTDLSGGGTSGGSAGLAGEDSLLSGGNAVDPAAPTIRQSPMHAETARAATEAGLSVPLPPELVDQVKMMIDQGKILTAQARLAGMPPPLGIVPPEALVEITDQTTAQFTQTIFDGLWEQCGGIEATCENILNKKVLGWQATLFESDRTKIAYGESPITLTNVEGAHVFFDPSTSSYRAPRHVIMLEPVTYEEAVAKYPDLDIEAVKDKFQSGTISSRNTSRANSRLFDLDSARDRAVIRTLWIRDWRYPMDPDEAVSCGKLQIGQVPIEQPTQQPTGPEFGIGSEAGVDPGQTGPPIAPLPVPTRQAFIDADTGEETALGLPTWPVIYGWREIRDIEGEELFDRRCKLPIAPIVNNINIPIPFSPYGFGEPDRLDGLQMAINMVLSDLVEHQRWLTKPIEVRHQSVADALGTTLKKKRMQLGAPINVPRDIASELNGDLSQVLQYVQMPPMSADSWRLLEFLVEAIDKEANNSEVQQGEAPQGTSGAWVANLQAAAAQVAQVTSQSTEAWLKKLVRLFVHFIAHDMTEKDAMKYSTKYPPAIIGAFKRKQKQLYHDITVEIQSGSAAAKQGQTNSMIGARGQGMTVSEPSILERLNLDPDAEIKREAEWLQKKVDSGLIQQQVEDQQGSGEGGKKKESSSNGNGQRSPN